MKVATTPHYVGAGGSQSVKVTLEATLTKIPKQSVMMAPPESTSCKGFFDLAPEIRNIIYHHLFDDLRIVVREHDEQGVHRNRKVLGAVGISRKREMGLNLIFASKQCLAETKPIILSAPEFDVDIYAILTGRRGRSNTRQTWPKNLQGFSVADLTLVRKIEIADTSWTHRRGKPWDLGIRDRCC